MTWNLSKASKVKQLERAFTNRQIDFTNPGFCDHENFIRAERKDPRFLEVYAKYIEAKQYSESYLLEARRKILIASEAVKNAITEDGELSMCVYASGILARMLDKLGVWNYVAKACLTITYPVKSQLPKTYFYGVDYLQTVAPHAVVVAPPFYIIDVSAKYQPYDSNQSEFIPEIVLLDSYTPATWNINDIIAPEISQEAISFGMSLKNYVQAKHSNMLEVANELPARSINLPDSTLMNYIIVAVGGFIEPLEDIAGYKPSSRSALEIFTEDVLPKL